MITPAYRPALTAHVLNATPPHAVNDDAIPGERKWTWRRMLAWVLGLSLAAYITVIFAATLLAQLARYGS